MWYITPHPCNYIIVLLYFITMFILIKHILHKARAITLTIDTIIDEQYYLMGLTTFNDYFHYIVKFLTLLLFIHPKINVNSLVVNLYNYIMIIILS